VARSQDRQPERLRALDSAQGKRAKREPSFFDRLRQRFPERIPRAACLFEQYVGGFAWRRTHGGVESRRERDLVLRTIGHFGSYVYAFDWVFRQDGTINSSVISPPHQAHREISETKLKVY